MIAALGSTRVLLGLSAVALTASLLLFATRPTPAQFKEQIWHQALPGVKHRAAIRALFVDPSFSDLHASTADISHFVKVYALETVRR